MTTEKQLRDELLKQNGVGTQRAEDLRDKILAKYQAQVTRMRRLVIFTWGLVAASLVGAFMVRVFFPEIVEFRPQLQPLFITVFQPLLLLAIIFTISLYLRSRALTMHQIQARLAGIEEQLRKMAQKD